MLDVLAREVLKFGVVGLVAFVVDVGLFNVLRFGAGVLWLHSATGPLHQHPLTAKAISTSLATLVAWLGNRHWTYRHRRSRAVHHELALFVLFNVAGMMIALGCLALSHYALDLRSGLADNISGNGVGLVLGTLFRFWAYRRFVFRDPDLETAQPSRSGPHEAPSGRTAEVGSTTEVVPASASDRKSAKITG